MEGPSRAASAPSGAPVHPSAASASAPVTARQRPPGELRGTIPVWQSILCGAASLLVVLVIWWFVTRGAIAEERILSRAQLPSPSETFRRVGVLFKDRNVDINTLVSLRRVGIGFLVAILVGVPLGILCGCFPRVDAFFAPLSLFGRNIPMAALIPLTLSFFGNGERQKVMFIVLAAVAFIISDTSRAIRDVADRYIDTAFTLGASRWQTVSKVLVPLAMPAIWDSWRLLFGLAFGYIMLAETVQTDANAGLGALINVSYRRGLLEDIYLVLILIPLVAFGIDRMLAWIQRQLFPHRYGSAGLLKPLVRSVARAWQGLIELIFPAAEEEERYRKLFLELSKAASAKGKG